MNKYNYEYDPKHNVIYFHEVYVYSYIWISNLHSTSLDTLTTILNYDNFYEILVEHLLIEVGDYMLNID